MGEQAVDGSRLEKHVLVKFLLRNLKAPWVIGLNYLHLRDYRKNLHLPQNPFCQTVRSRIQIIIGLEAQPKFGRGAEVAAQPQGSSSWAIGPPVIHEKFKDFAVLTFNF
jgi:hypothetical protein